MKRLIIIGSGALGEQAAHYAVVSGEYEVVGYLNDFLPVGSVEGGYPILGGISSIYELYAQDVFDFAFIAIGYNHFDFKEKVYHELVEHNIPLGTIIAPNVYIDPTATVGQGCFLYPGVVVDKDATIEDCALLNIHVTISHNSVIGRHCFIAGGVTVCGFVKVGKKVFVGANSAINDNLQICDNVRIGSGTFIRESIDCPGTYVTQKNTIKLR